ncbi:hypothetical protein BDZ97DRAFT_1795694 [Flammula alnicola]|nr:hypothetical protein BDZ97DRAFT_1795694 [Flammula alnicola]
MSSHQQHSSLLSQSSGPASQLSSVHIYSCKWAWCRCTFSDNAALVHHVVHDHARRSIPVRRRDIAMIRRAEEGSGESFKISYLMKDLYSSNSEKSTQISAEQASVIPAAKEPSSSLPSPPASSPPFYVARSQAGPLPTRQSSSTPPTSESQEENQPLPEPSTAGKATKAAVPSATPELEASQEQRAIVSTPTFASLSSPADSPAPLPIPNSPSFSSLVERPNKRKLAFEVPENAPQSKLYHSQSHPLSQSTSSFSSTGSQLSVEMQLTQSPESGSEGDDSDEDAVGEIDEAEQLPLEHVTASDSSDAVAPAPVTNKDQEQELYKAELPWDPSQHQESQNAFSSEPDSSMQESGSGVANFDLLTQPPSQFQYESFPIHHHGPKISSRLPHPIETDPSSSAPLHLSSPAPLSSPTFAVSTPQRQNWYQPPVRRQRSSKKIDPHAVDEDASKVSPVKPEVPSSRPNDRRRSRTPKPKNTQKKSAFRSGTVQITPVSIPPEPIPEEPQDKPQHLHDDPMSQDVAYGFDNSQTQSQPYMDLDDSQSHDYSYPPLQTQAPYQSQTMSQF